MSPLSMQVDIRNSGAQNNHAETHRQQEKMHQALPASMMAEKYEKSLTMMKSCAMMKDPAVMKPML